MNNIPATVLVIEPHPLMREALCAAIADDPELKVGLQTGHVTEALRMARRILPDIILLALSYADPADLGELRVLHRSLPHIPILALTRNEGRGVEQAVLEHGAQAVVTKSAPRAELIRVLRQMRRQVFASHPETFLPKEASNQEPD